MQNGDPHGYQERLARAVEALVASQRDIRGRVVLAWDQLQALTSSGQGAGIRKDELDALGQILDKNIDDLSNDHLQDLALRIFRLYQAVSVDILDAQS